MLVLCCKYLHLVYAGVTRLTFVFGKGMTLTCFDCITLTAVLMFDIETRSDQNGVVIALLADGVFQMEPLAPPEATLFYVELLIKVELNFIEGYIAADAALSPAS